MVRFVLVLSCAALLAGEMATAGAPSNESPGLICRGRELGLTRWEAAYEFAWNYCSCNLPPEEVPSCALDISHQLLVGHPNTLVCGDMLVDGVWRWTIDIYDECAAETAACAGLPLKCWELTGWNL